MHLIKVSQVGRSCIACFVTFLCIQSTAFSQPIVRDNFGETNEFYNDLFLHSSWEVMFSPNVTAGAKISHDDPAATYQLHSSPQVSFAFGIQRTSPLNTRMGFTTGLQLGLVTRNATFTVPGAEIGLDNFETYHFTGAITREADIAYFAIPAQVEYRWLKNQKYFYYSTIGISLRLAMFNSTSNADMEVMEVRLHGNKTPFINIHGSGGIAFVLRNIDILKVGVLLNFDPAYIAKGPFHLETESSYDHGTYFVKGTSAGLSFIYTRTKSKRSR